VPLLAPAMAPTRNGTDPQALKRRLSTSSASEAPTKTASPEEESTGERVPTPPPRADAHALPEPKQVVVCKVPAALAADVEPPPGRDREPTRPSDFRRTLQRSMAASGGGGGAAEGGAGMAMSPYPQQLAATRAPRGQEAFGGDVDLEELMMAMAMRADVATSPSYVPPDAHYDDRQLADAAGDGGAGGGGRWASPLYGVGGGGGRMGSDPLGEYGWGTGAPGGGDKERPAEPEMSYSPSQPAQWPSSMQPVSMIHRESPWNMPAQWPVGPPSRSASSLGGSKKTGYLGASLDA
jgi:hypothetical protein